MDKNKKNYKKIGNYFLIRELVYSLWQYRNEFVVLIVNIVEKY